MNADDKLLIIFGIIAISCVVYMVIETMPNSSMDEFNYSNDFFKDARELRDDEIYYTSELGTNSDYLSNKYHIEYGGFGMADVYSLYKHSDGKTDVYKRTYGEKDQNININFFGTYSKPRGIPFKYEVYVFVCDPHGNKYRKSYDIISIEEDPDRINEPSGYNDVVEYCKSSGGCGV